VPRAEPLRQQFEGGGRIGEAIGAAGRLRTGLPVCPLQEVDEIDPERLLGLSDLPVWRTGLFEVRGEAPYVILEGLVGGRAGQKPANPADAVGGGALGDEARGQEERAELLEAGVEVTHRWYLDDEGQSACQARGSRGWGPRAGLFAARHWWRWSSATRVSASRRHSRRRGNHGSRLPILPAGIAGLECWEPPPSYGACWT